MLPKEAIKQFKDLYFKHYGIELTDTESSLKANNLMSLYEAVYGDLLTGRDQFKKHEIIREKV